VDGDIGGFDTERGGWNDFVGGGERPGRGWNGEGGDGASVGFWDGGKAGRVRAAERRGELLLFVTSSSRSNRHGL